MVKRVLIRGGQSAAMLVSLPGVDVGSATINQTCFDSRWSGYTPYAIGKLTSFNDNPAMFNFGETLDQPPLCLSNFVILNGSGLPSTTFSNTPAMLRGGGIDQWWYVLCTTQFLQFRAKFGGSAATLSFSLFKRTSG